MYLFHLMEYLLLSRSNRANVGMCRTTRGNVPTTVHIHRARYICSFWQYDMCVSRRRTADGCACLRLLAFRIVCLSSFNPFRTESGVRFGRKSSPRCFCFFRKERDHGGKCTCKSILQRDRRAPGWALLYCTLN